MFLCFLVACYIVLRCEALKLSCVIRDEVSLPLLALSVRVAVVLAAVVPPPAQQMGTLAVKPV
jgi:hypothetical protein